MYDAEIHTARPDPKYPVWVRVTLLGNTGMSWHIQVTYCLVSQVARPSRRAGLWPTAKWHISTTSYPTVDTPCSARSPERLKGNVKTSGAPSIMEQITENDSSFWSQDPQKTVITRQMQTPRA